jgi:hypothetical protein
VTFRRWLTIVFTVLLGSAAVLVVALLHALRFVQQPGYPEHNTDPSILLQDSGFRLRKQCDVLVFGDSTANVGIDPRVITSNTGLSACNIAVTRPVIDDLGGLALDAYLEHNPRPKLLVLQFGPEDFYPARSPWEHAAPFSPLVMLARDVPRPRALRIMLRHPAETAQFVLYMLKEEFAPRMAYRAERLQEFHRALQHAAESNGQLDLALPAQTACPASGLPLYGPLDPQWGKRWREKYEAQGIPVLIRLSPVPACDPQLAKFRAELAPYVDGPLEELPIADFGPGDRHTTPAGSQAETMGLVKLIEARQPGLVQHARP